MATNEVAAPKRRRGRPARPEPEPIPDTPENIVASVLRTRTKEERERILAGLGSSIASLLGATALRVCCRKPDIDHQEWLTEGH